MGDRAKLFQTGGSQAVRLPRAYSVRVGQREVLIRREGRRVIIESVRRTWSPRFVALAGSAPDFPTPDEPADVEPGPELD